MKFLAAGNAQHIGKRSEQQDSFGFSDPTDNAFAAHGGMVAVVADGMGGLAHGKLASQTAAQTFLDAYQAKSSAESIPDALYRSIEAANDAVVSLAVQSGTRNGLGTTLAAAVFHQKELYWISAGDSRVYLCTGGRINRLTADHVYANDLQQQVAKGETTQLLAESHPERASLTSYLGLASLPKVDRAMKPLPLRPGDAVLVCSDGLYRSVSEEQMAEALQLDATQACESLIQEALAAGNPAQDNMTVLVLRYLPGGLVAPLRFGKRGLQKAGLITALGLIAFSGGAFFWLSYGRSLRDNHAGHPTTQAAVAAPQDSRQSALSAQPQAANPTGRPPGQVLSTPTPKIPLEIRNFDAVPEADAAFRLQWTLAGTKSEDCKLRISGADGRVVGRNLPASQQQGLRVSPRNPTTYVLTAVCGNKTLSQSVLATPAAKPGNPTR